MERELEAKYKSEVMRLFGLALMTPFCLKVSTLVNQESYDFTINQQSFISWLGVFISFIAGYSVIAHGLVIIEQYYDKSYTGTKGISKNE